MRKIIIILMTLIMGAGIALSAGTAKADTYDELVMQENSGWCMTSTTTPSNGAAVFIYQCFDRPNQEWAWIQATPDFHFLKYNETDSSGHTYCLNIGGGQGTQYILWQCDGSINQEFFAEVNGTGQSFAEAADASKVIALNNNNLSDYEPLISWPDVYNAPYEKMYFLGT